MQRVGSNLTLGLTGPLVAFAAASATAFDKQEKAIAQVNAGLQTTGNLVGFTSEQLQKQAAELQKNTLFGDEEILKNATAQLLTFTNIAGKQFERTQLAALNLATRLDGDLKSASIQLGKALNDPVANLSALSRSGIQFSKDQKKVINSLVAAGKAAEAQTIILDELEKQYGGSAEAAAKAGLGPFKQLQNSIGDLTEEFGEVIVNGLTPFIEKIREITESFSALSPETKRQIVAFGAFAAAIGPVIAITGTLLRSIGAITAAVRVLTLAIAANPLGAFAIALAAVLVSLEVYNRVTRETVRTQSLLNRVTDEANDSIAEQQARVQALLAIARSEKVSKEERLKAIQQLNAISPTYLGNLKLETINTDQAREAVEKYNEALLQNARVKAAQAKLEEIQAKIIEQQLQAAKDDAKIEERRSGFIKQQVAAGRTRAQAESLYNSLVDTGNTAFDQRIEKLKEQSQLLLDIIAQGAPTLGGGNVSPDINLGDGEGGSIGFEVFDPDEIDAFITGLGGRVDEALANANVERFDNFLGGLTDNIPDDFMESEAERLRAFTDEMERVRERSEAVGSAVGEAFANMSSNFVSSLNLADSGFEGFVKGLIGTVGKLIAILLSQSVAQSIAGATASGTATGPAAVFTTPGFIAAAVSGVLGAFAAIPKFETGGIVGGSSFYGDKILARLNSAELILNQNQQRDLLGLIDAGGNIGGKIQVEGVLSGADIKLSGERQVKLEKRLGK